VYELLIAKSRIAAPSLGPPSYIAKYSSGREPSRAQCRRLWTNHRKAALGQNRKSSVGLGMSGVGWQAEVDFGRL